VSPTAERVRLLQGTVALVGVVAGVESARLAFSSDWYAFGDTSFRTALPGLAAGAALLAVGVAQLGSIRTRTTGALLAAASIAWFISIWDAPDAPIPVFLVGRLLGTVWPVLVAHALILMFGTLQRTERVCLLFAYGATIGVHGVAATVVFDPASTGCSDCSNNPLLMIDAPRAAAWFERTATVMGFVWAALLLAALALRLAAATPARRRLTTPIVAVGMALLGLVAAGYLRAVVRRLTEPDDTALWLPASVLLLMLCATTAWPALSLALARQRLARLVVDASAIGPAGGLGPVVASVVRDPTARLLYPRGGDEDAALIDADGERAVPLAQLTALNRGSETVAYLEHRAPLLDQDGTLIAQVARLSLDHERLHAERTAQLRELRASRVRIVAAADSERRRLERDLHDGAQQRLVSLALGLRLAESGDGRSRERDGALLADAEKEVASALAELRRIARGLYPRELADEGLVAALETFSESDPTPVLLDLNLPDRAPADVESAAYFAVAYLLSTATFVSAASRAVHAWHRGERLQLIIDGSCRTEDLTAVEDRVGALGGTLDRVDSGSVMIELPCAS
jgi:signal transduction histidine kinase